MDKSTDSQKISPQKLASLAILFGWLALFAALGVLAAPAIFPQWEMADSAMAYAYGHLQLGLGSTEQAQGVIEQANRTLQLLRGAGGCIGVGLGALTASCFVRCLRKPRDDGKV